MNRGAGIGLLALGIVLGVVGAIMRYAVSATTHGFDFHQAGFILLVVGIGVVVLSVLMLVLGGRSRSVARTDIRRGQGWPRRSGRRRWRR
jgi:hypothetical protein